MKVVGIIAEYNPFHQGHLHQISFVREHRKADYIVAVMSGDFVQRGTPALLSKHARARAALLCGVDLVLELPVSFSGASAEFFAGGGVEILNGIGVVDELCFGSEEGEMPLFLHTARILCEEPEEYRILLKNELKNGLSFPSARCRALTEYTARSGEMISSGKYGRFLAEPNNILGIEYCKALLRLHSSIRPVTLKREGAGYHEKNLSRTQAPSASGIRAYLKSDAECIDGVSFHPSAGASGTDTLKSSLKHLIPDASLEILTKAQSENRLVFESDLDSLLAYRLFMETFETLCTYPDVSSELASRIIRLRNQYTGFLQFASLLKTKELTQTRIQRALLHIFLNIHEIPKSPGYARVLGFRKSASPLLSAIKKEGRIPLITKTANAESLLDETAYKTFQTNTIASNVYESLLISKTNKPIIHEYEKPIVICI